MTISKIGIIKIDNAWDLWNDNHICKILFFKQNTKHYNIYPGQHILLGEI